MCILHTVVLGQHIADDKQVGSCVHPVTYQVPLSLTVASPLILEDILKKPSKSAVPASILATTLDKK
jgi:hypothetical protein